MQLRSGRHLNTEEQLSYKKIEKTVDENMEIIKPTERGRVVMNLISKYLNYFKDTRKKYILKFEENPNNCTDTIKFGKEYVVEMARIIIELYAIINENFDVMTNELKNPTNLINTCESKANELIKELEKRISIERHRYRGHDLSLVNNCIIEMYLFLGNVNKYRKI